MAIKWRLDDDRGDAALLQAAAGQGGRFSAEQADALAETIGAVSIETLATKGDIAAIRAGSRDCGLSSSRRSRSFGPNKAEISEVKTATVELKADLLKWIIGAIGFQTLVIIGALVTLGRLIGK